MDEADVKSYQTALKEERVQLAEKLARADAAPTNAELRRLCDLHTAIEAFQAVIEGGYPGGNVYMSRGLAGS